jgi:hypothetical protein
LETRRAKDGCEKAFSEIFGESFEKSAKLPESKGGQANGKFIE